MRNYFKPKSSKPKKRVHFGSDKVTLSDRHILTTDKDFIEIYGKKYPLLRSEYRIMSETKKVNGRLAFKVFNKRFYCYQLYVPFTGEFITL